jgi:hypothetical protein
MRKLLVGLLATAMIPVAMAEDEYAKQGYSTILKEPLIGPVVAIKVDSQVKYGYVQVCVKEVTPKTCVNAHRANNESFQDTSAQFYDVAKTAMLSGKDVKIEATNAPAPFEGWAITIYNKND